MLPLSRAFCVSPALPSSLNSRQASSCFPPIYPRRETPFAIDAVLHRLGQTCDLIFRPFARGNSFGARHKSDKHRRGKIHRVQF